MVPLILFTVEVVTVILRPRTLLTLHVVVGLTLVPPLLVKISSVSWRLVHYYYRANRNTHSREHRSQPGGCRQPRWRAGHQRQSVGQPEIDVTQFSRALLALAEKEQLRGQPLTPPSDDSRRGERPAGAAQPRGAAGRIGQNFRGPGRRAACPLVCSAYRE